MQPVVLKLSRMIPDSDIATPHGDPVSYLEILEKDKMKGGTLERTLKEAWQEHTTKIYNVHVRTHPQYDQFCERSQQREKRVKDEFMKEITVCKEIIRELLDADGNLLTETLAADGWPFENRMGQLLSADIEKRYVGWPV